VVAVCSCASAQGSVVGLGRGGGTAAFNRLLHPEVSFTIEP
jgi:hypothetical protein